MAKIGKSIRIDPTLWARVEAFAIKHGLKVNGAVERLLELGLFPTSIPVVKSDHQIYDDLGKEALKLLNTAPNARSVAKPKPTRKAVHLKGVQLGPAESKPGERLKTNVKRSRWGL